MTKKKKPLIVLAQSLEQPRIVKRILQKSSVEDSIHVYGYKRKIHSVKNYGILEQSENVTLTFVGNLEDGHYISRIFSYLKLLAWIYCKHGLTKKRLYVFGLDLRMVSFFLLNSNVTYEISDIMWLYKQKKVKYLLSNIDKILAKKSEKVVFTSLGFYENHYKDHVKKEHVVIEENKFAAYGKVKPIEIIRQDKLSIAYIGAFRYTDVVKNLIESVLEIGSIELNFYGDGPKDIVSYIKKHAEKTANISFHGAFKNPDDLEEIYQNNNLNFVVYDNRSENERIAMPNKFYESGFFNVPIVCATNTYVGKRVLDNKMGWTCGISKNEIKSFLNSLSVITIVEYHNHIKTLSKEKFSV